MKQITDDRFQISDGEGECFAKEAKDKLRELVEGKEIKLEKDISNMDKYNRLLRYVYVNENNINQLLVREGYAKLATYPPDTKYYKKLKEAQKIAEENKLGLWGKCY
jgi:micrococcal nuclease